MKDKFKSKQQLIEELAVLRQQVTELQAESLSAKLKYQQTEQVRYGNITQLELLFKHVSAFLWTVDTKLRFTSSMGTGPLTFNLHPDELVGTTLYDYFQTKDPESPPIQAHLQALKGEPASYEIMRGGIALGIYVEPFHNPQGKIVGAVGVALNITKNKLSEQAQKQSEVMFRTLVETSAAAIFISEGTRLLYVNSAAESISGYGQAELLTMDFIGLVHPESRKFMQGQLIAYKQRAPILPRHEVKLLTKSGETRWVDITMGAVEFDGLTALLGTAFDITARKHASAQLEQLLAIEQQQRLLSETLSEVTLALTSKTSRDEVLDEILRQVQRIVSYSAANITLLESGILRVVRGQGYQTFGGKQTLATFEQKLTELPLDTKVVQSRQPMVITDTRRTREWVAVADSAWIRSFVAVPICLHNRVLGLLRLDSDVPTKFSNHDGERLRPLVNAAAIALENARLYDQVRQELAERKQVEKEVRALNNKLLTLQYAGATIASSLDLQVVLDTLSQEIVNLLDAEGCSISEWNQENNTLSIIAGYSSNENVAETEYKEYSLEDFPLAEHLTQPRAEQITINQVDIVPAERIYMQNIPAKTLLLMPMEFQNRMIGLIEVTDNRSERIFTPEDISLAQLMTNQAASAIENARLYAETRRRLNEQLALRESILAISSSLNLETVLDHIVEQMGRAVDATSAYLCSYESKTMRSTVLAEYFGPRVHLKERKSTLGLTYTLPRDFTSNFELLEIGQYELVHFEETDTTENGSDYLGEFRAKTLLNIPLQIGEGIIAFAELWESERQREFSPQEINLCQSIAYHAAIALENARLYNQSRQELSERKQIELELRKVAARNQAILDAIPDSMFYFSHTGQLLDHKMSSEDDPILPELLSEMGVANNDSGDVILRDLANLLQESINKAVTSHTIQFFDYQHTSLHGSQDFETRLVVSGPHEVLAIMRNITEQKRAERQTIQAERLEALEELSAILAHEINNPLQAIQSPVDLMLKYTLEPEEIKRYLRIIRQQIERVKSITQETLNFARPQVSSRQQISVPDAIEQVLDLVHQQIEQNDIRITVDAQDIPPILADPNQLNQVFLNLILNAIAAMDNEGQLNITIYPDEDNIAISFMNDGPIIPTKILPHIFEPFFTTKADGNGLGLWVSHSLIRQHNGSLTAENLTDDRGVVFTIKLPCL